MGKLLCKINNPHILFINRCSQIADQGLFNIKNSIKRLALLQDINIDFSGYIFHKDLLKNLIWKLDAIIWLILESVRFSRVSKDLSHWNQWDLSSACKISVFLFLKIFFKLGETHWRSRQRCCKRPEETHLPWKCLSPIPQVNFLSQKKFYNEKRFAYSGDPMNIGHKTFTTGLLNLKSLKRLSLIFEGFSFFRQHIHFFLDVDQ